jgi:hypothetical protein
MGTTDSAILIWVPEANLDQMIGLPPGAVAEIEGVKDL